MISLRAKKYGFAIIIVLFTCLLAETATGLGWLTTFENAFYDLWHKAAGKRSNPEFTVIASLDDKTLLDHREEPMVFWGPYFARAITVLREAGVQCIGIDLLFSVSIESWLKKLDTPQSELSRTYDIPMREQLSKGSVILVGNLAVNEKGETELLLPVVDYLYSLPGGEADVGLGNLFTDEDGVVRRFIPMLPDNQNNARSIFGYLMAMRLSESLPRERRPSFPEEIKKNPAIPRAIGYVGPPGTIPRISFRDLIKPNAAADPRVKNLKGKVVIISAEHAGTGNDIHLTPYVQQFLSRGNAMMTGAELQANIVETILSGRFPRPAPGWLRLLILAFFVSGGTALFLRLPPLYGVGCILLLSAFSTGIAYMLFSHNLLFPVTSVFFALILSYVGALGRRLTREEKQRSRLQKTFGPYVSDAVVDKVLTSGKQPNLGGETLNVTVLFSDIRSFTTISEQLDSNEVVEMLNTYYSLVCEPILAQGGMVDKFVGDAVMAIFGAPVPYEDQERKSLIAALEIAEIARKFKNWTDKRFPHKNIPDFRIGIGLHSGEAVIGNIGSPKRMGYTAIGDTVNIASRLESMSKQLGWTIVASRATVEAAGGDLKLGATDYVTPSGREGKIEVVELLGMNQSKEEKNELQNNP